MRIIWLVLGTVFDYYINFLKIRIENTNRSNKELESKFLGRKIFHRIKDGKDRDLLGNQNQNTINCVHMFTKMEF
jgi:hypothetical protein